MRISKEKNVTDLLLYQNEHSEQKIGFYQRDTSTLKISYQEVFKNSLKVANYLKELGIKKGERVAIVLPTHQDFYYAFFGSILLGAVPVALYPPVRLAKLDEWKKKTSEMMKKVNSKVVLTNPMIFPLMGSPVLSARIPFGAKIVEKILKDGSENENVISSPNEDDLAFIQFSSGTTGHSKPVSISHKNLMANTLAIMTSFPLSAFSGGGVSWLPLYHDMGLVGMVFGPMFIDGKQTLIPPELFIARPVTWLEVISKNKASITVAPNFAFGLCVKKIREKDSKDLDLSSLQVALCGAEVVHPETMAAFSEKFIPFGLNPNVPTPVYGLAESTLAVTFSPYDRPVKWNKFSREKLEEEETLILDTNGTSLASVGRPLKGVDIAIRNSEVKDYPVDEFGNTNKLGIIWVKGDSIMKGYLDCPEENEKTIKDGWLDTGDRGFLFEHELYISGRAKETIIIRGRNIDPSTVERSLLGIEGLREGCSVSLGVANKNLGTEELYIVCELKKPQLSENKLLEIEKSIKSNIKRDHSLQVSGILLTPPSILPRTSSGKIKRIETKHFLINGQLNSINKSNIKMEVAFSSIKGLLDHKINQVKNIFSSIDTK